LFDTKAGAALIGFERRTMLTRSGWSSFVRAKLTFSEAALTQGLGWIQTVSKTRRSARFVLPFVGGALMLIGLWPLLTEVLPGPAADVASDYLRWGATALGFLALASHHYLKLRDDRRAEHAEAREMKAHKHRIDGRH
jgi:hypothetical protein